MVELLAPFCHHGFMSSTPLIRASKETDLPSVTHIYAHYVRHSTASFETDPPDLDEMARRRQEMLNRGLPYLVAELDGGVAGFAYATNYRTRAAYRFTVEDSIYVHPDYVGKGIGRLLLAALIHACEKTSCRQMIAVIGGEENSASMRLHRSFGFEQVGILQSVGFKFGAWVDTMLMQRAIGLGNATKPADA
jgi:L-amino acid N-acyltransferase YncA